jgi:hypothetical protein
VGRVRVPVKVPTVRTVLGIGTTGPEIGTTGPEIGTVAIAIVVVLPATSAPESVIAETVIAATAHGRVVLTARPLPIPPVNGAGLLCRSRRPSTTDAKTES